MIESSAFFQKLALDYDVRVLPDSELVISRKVTNKDGAGFFLSNMREFEEGVHDTIPLVAMLPFAEVPEDAAESYNEFSASANQENYENVDGCILFNGCANRSYAIAAQTCADTAQLSVASAILHRSVNKAVLPDNPSDEVLPILEKVCSDAGVKLVGTESTDSATSWRIDTGARASATIQFSVNRADSNGVPFLKISMPVPDDFFYNHSLFQNQEMFHPSFMYEHDMRKSDVEKYITETAAGLNFRVPAVAHFNIRTLLYQLGLRMCIDPQTSRVEVHQKVALLNPITEDQIVARLGCITGAYAERLFSPQIENSTASNVLHYGSLAIHAVKKLHWAASFFR